MTGSSRNRVQVRHLGLLSYADGLARQADAAAEVRAPGGPAGIVLSLRHTPVITLGRRTSPQEVHADPVELGRHGIELFNVDRGGGATYHYPGQAVVYPVLDLRRLRLTVPSLLALASRALLAVLDDCGIPGARWDAERPGVYVAGAKIASLGFHLSADLTTHGVSLNVGTGWDGFSLIDPCKEPGLPVTSMADVLGALGAGVALGASPDPDEVAQALAQAFVLELAR